MKITWHSASIITGALFFAGCKIYDDNYLAPVYDENYYKSENTSPAVTRFGRPIPNPEVARAAAARATAPNKANSVSSGESTQSNLVVDSPKPYQSYTPVRPQANDGWDVEPNTQKQLRPGQSSVANGNSVPEEAKIAPPSNSDDAMNTASSAQTAIRPQLAQTINENGNDIGDSAQQTDTNADNNAQNVASATPPSSSPQKSNGAVQALLKQASTSLSQNKLDDAVAYLEDANRIQPKNAKILYDIANIYYHQGKYREAESFAGRSIQVGGGGNSVLKKSWSLIANARKALGDNQGAVTAAEKAASLAN